MLPGNKVNPALNERPTPGVGRAGASRSRAKGPSPFRPGLLRLLLLPLPAFLLLLAAAGCDFIEGLSETPTAPPPSPAAAPTAVPTPAPPAGPGLTNTPSASGIVLSVLVAKAHSGLPDYNRREWRHWTDEDGDCQNARQEALIAESTIAVTFQSNDRCRVESGRWQGPYTGEIVADPGELDIDHMVPLENAHRSGGWAWDGERKQEYANFLGYENHLIATTASANRSKGSKGPEEWRPPLESYWCSYAVDWATVKSDWGLSVTESEFAALSEMLATCPATVLLQPIRGRASTPPAATSRPTPPPDLRYDPFGPDRNCSDFDTYEEALAFFIAAGGPYNDPHNLDMDGDGEPCESLPGGPSAREPPPQDTTMALYAALRQGAPFGDGDCLSPTSEMDCELQPSAASAPTPEPSPEPSPSIPASPPAAIVVPTPTPTPPPAATVVPTPTPKPTPPPTPELAGPPEESFVDRDCGDFADWMEAQAFYLSEGGPNSDPHSLDGDGDGVACQSLPGAPQPAASPMPEPTPTPFPESTPKPALSEMGDAPAFVGLPFDPYGPDRNCGDFNTWWDAQNFYFAAGGPDEDPHGLDRNGDGIVCESLPGAPSDATEEPSYSSSTAAQPTPAQPAPAAEEFQDRNCSDFDTWRQAQDFFEAEGGPDEDPHGLDQNGDGIVCESLPGAPGDDTEESRQKRSRPRRNPPRRLRSFRTELLRLRYLAAGAGLL